ncbi:blue light receptor, partial [Tulasnella sp. 427]
MADPGPSHLTNNKKSSKSAASSSTAAVSKDKQDLDQKHTKAFDFTQRKRWADILVNELSGAIMFVLNSAGLIVFVGEAARELLNWNDTSVQGMEFAALIHPDDISPFSKAFVGSIRDHAELDIFIRLKSYHTEAAQAHTGGKWPMYEIRGHPHFGAPNPSAPFAMGTVLPQAECK